MGLKKTVAPQCMQEILINAMDANLSLNSLFRLSLLYIGRSDITT